MTGQIPPYGANFRRESAKCVCGLAPRVYTLKANPIVFIRADWSSKHWRVWVGDPMSVAFPVGYTTSTMRDAMALAIRAARALER